MAIEVYIRYAAVKYVYYLVRICRHIWVVGDHYEGLAVALYRITHAAHHVVRRFGVKVAGRLIGEYYVRVCNQRPCYAYALLLSAGHLPRHVVHVAFKANVLQRLLCHPHALIVGHPPKRQRKRHVFKGRVVRHEVEGLEYEPHVLLPEKYKLGLVHSFKVLAVYDYLAAGHGLEACQHIQKGGFAAAASADYAAKFSGHYLQVYSPQGMDVDASHPVYLGNVAQIYYRLLLSRLFLGGFAFHRILLLIMPYMAYTAL